LINLNHLGGHSFFRDRIGICGYIVDALREGVPRRLEDEVDSVSVLVYVGRILDFNVRI